MPTGLHPATSKLVRDEWEKLRREKIEPWNFMEVGNGLDVVDFYGRHIRYRGIKFLGSPRDIFWGRYMNPFLEDLALRVIDRTVELCRSEGRDPRLAVVEAGVLLKRVVRSAFDYMAAVDRRLLGEGNPQNVPLRDVRAEVTELNAFIDARIRGLLEVLEPPRTTLQRLRTRWEHNKIGAAIVIALAVMGVLGMFAETISRFVTLLGRLLPR